MLEKVCYRGLLRICTLPDNHPLHERIREYSDNPQCTQPTPLHNLLKIFNIVPEFIETITLPTRLPAHDNVFVTEIASNRDLHHKREAR